MEIEALRIQDLRLSKTETAALHALAGAMLMDAGYSREETVEYMDTLTPANIVRVALGFTVRKRGGARPNTGNRKDTPVS
jgi:hypothetical protein